MSGRNQNSQAKPTLNIGPEENDGKTTESGVNWNDSTPTEDFFSKILPSLGIDKEMLQQKISVAKKELEAFNVSALKYFTKEQLEQKLGIPVAGRIQEVLKTNKLSYGYNTKQTTAKTIAELIKQLKQLHKVRDFTISRQDFHSDWILKERIKEATLVLDRVKSLFEAFLNDDPDRNQHPFIVMATASGMGKTRFGCELLRLLRVLDTKDSTLSQLLCHACWRVFIEFNGEGDKLGFTWKDERQKLYGADERPQTAIAVRLLARGLFNVSTITFRSWITFEEESLIQNTTSVLEFIGEEIRNQIPALKQMPISLLLHIDEYQLAAQEAGANYVKEMLYTIGQFCCRRNVDNTETPQSAASKNGLFLIPFLTGTAIDGAEWVEITKYPTVQIPLFPLKFQSMWQLLVENCPNTISIKEILKQKLMQVVVGDLGGNPRCLSIVVNILKSMANSDFTGAVTALTQFVGGATRFSLFPATSTTVQTNAKTISMDELMKNTFNNFEERYSIPRFVEYVGQPGISQLISYALTQQLVSWETKIGDKTLMKIAYLGHVAVQPQKNGRLLVSFPLILLHFMAVSIQDSLLIEITAFPRPEVTPTNFEREFVVGFTVLRINAKFQIARQQIEEKALKESSAKETDKKPPCTCTIGELFIGYGSEEILNQAIVLQNTERVFEEGMWTHLVEVEHKEPKQSVKSMKEQIHSKRKHSEPSKSKKELANKKHKIAPDASITPSTQRNLRPQKRSEIQDPVVELSESDEEDIDDKDTSPKKPKQENKTKSPVKAKKKEDSAMEVEEEPQSKKGKGKIGTTKLEAKNSKQKTPKKVKELRVKSEDKVQVRLSCKGHLQEILFSAGQHILLCETNNHIADARFVAKAVNGKDFLFVLQVKFTGTDRKMSKDGKTKIAKFYNAVTKTIAPSYPDHRVIPVFITNNIESTRIIEECKKQYPDLILMTSSILENFMPSVAHRILTRKVEPVSHDHISIPVEKQKPATDWNSVFPTQMKKKSKDKVAAALQQQLNKYGLELLDVGAAGNCQFFALAHQIYGDKNQHLEIRAAAVIWMTEHPDDMKGFFAKEHEEEDTSTWEEYLASMIEDGSHGDERTLYAVSQALNVNIAVISANSDEIVYYRAPSQSQIEAVIAYDQYYKHYYASKLAE